MKYKLFFPISTLPFKFKQKKWKDGKGFGIVFI